MKFKLVLLILLCANCTYATGIGLSPGKINFGNAEPGKLYTMDIILVNGDSENKSIRFFSNSENLRTENEIYEVKGNEKKNVKLMLNVNDCTKKKNENIIIASSESDFNAGVGIKVSYEIKGECSGNKITGLSIVGDSGSINYKEYLIYGFFGLIALVLILRKIKFKNIFSRI